MSDLKDIVMNSIDNNFGESNLKEQTLLYSLAMKKIISLPYYKDIYYTASVAHIDNDTYGIHINECTDVGPNILYRSLISHEKNEINDEEREEYHYSNHYLLDNNVIERIEIFKDIVNKNKDIYAYLEDIFKKQSEDPDFLPTIYSYSFIFENFENNFFNDGIKDVITNNYDVNSIDSLLCKNNIYFYTFGKKSKLNEVLEEWEYNEDNRLSSIDNSENYYTRIDNIYNLYEDKLNIILKDVKKEKPFLFNSISDQNIQLYYLEIKGTGDNYDKDFELEDVENLSFSKEILYKNNIIIPKIHYIKDTNNSDKELYDSFSYDMQEKTEKFLIDFSNDLTTEVPEKYFGLDYLNKNILKPEMQATSFIVAKNENETIGFLSINSNDSGNKSIIKSINSVCIKENFRGSGLSYRLYDTLANILEEQGNILTNSHYSIEGKVKLPRLKNRVMEQHPNLLNISGAYYIDKNYSQNEQKKQDIITDFNSDFIKEIRILENKNPTEFVKNIEKIKSIYREGVKYININYNGDEEIYTKFHKNTASTCNNIKKLFNKKENTKKI